MMERLRLPTVFGVTVWLAGLVSFAGESLQPFTRSSDFFPIGAWDRHDAWRQSGRSVEENLRGLADCHFTLAGFVKPEDLALCEKLRLAAIVAPSKGDLGWFRNWRNLTDEAIEKGVRAMVDRAGTSRAVIGYTIMDEPGVAAFSKLATAVAAVKRYAPGALAHINLYPNYATLGAPDTSQLGTATYAEYLERFVAEVKPQFLCYDNYMVEYSQDLEDAKKCALYFTNLLEVRRVARKHGLPFWNVVCCNRIRKHTTIPSPANLAFQAYTTLAAGARGITWFKYYQGGYAYAPIDNSGRATETWYYLQVVNRQLKTLGPIMNRLTSTGVYFTSPPPDSSLPLLPGRVVKHVASRPDSKGGDAPEPPLMVGEFTGENGLDHVMIVNLSLERSANIRLELLKPCEHKQVVSATDGRLLPLDETNGHWLVAGQGALIALR